MEDGSGWLADPDDDGQERYFDGAEWTSETRLIESDVPPPHLPDHVPELQRALAAATADIDEVEERLGLLFDRAAGIDPEVAKARRGAGLSRRAEAQAAAAAAAAAALRLRLRLPSPRSSSRWCQRRRPRRRSTRRTSPSSS